MTILKCKTCGEDITVAEGAANAICSFCGTDMTLPTAAQGATAAVPGIESLHKRVMLFFEDGDFKQADEYCDRILDIDPEYAPAYIGKLCAELNLKNEADLAKHSKPLAEYSNYQKAVRFADSKLRGTYENYNKATLDRQEAERAEAERRAGLAKMAKKKALRTIKRIVIAVIVAAVAITLIVVLVIVPAMRYGDAGNLFEAGKYQEAANKYRWLGDYKDSAERELESRYMHAAGLYDAGQYADAAGWFSALDDYEDSSERASASRYMQAEELNNAGRYGLAIMIFYSLDGYKDSEERALELRPAWVAGLSQKISAGGYHTVGLKPDGKVVAVGNNDEGQCEVSGWSDIVSVSAGTAHTVGLKSDGTVIAVGLNGNGQCDVGDWSDIVSVSAGTAHTVGLKSDGTVVAIGLNDDGQCDVDLYNNVILISADGNRTLGVKFDINISNRIGAITSADNFRTITTAKSGVGAISVSAGLRHTVMLLLDGTVAAWGDSDADEIYGECNVGGWSDIVSISAGFLDYTVGLKSDGTVVAVGNNGFGQCDVSGWSDIVSISAGSAHTVGLKSNGTVVAVGENSDGQCDVGDWGDIIALSAGEEHTADIKPGETTQDSTDYYPDYEERPVSQALPATVVPDSDMARNYEEDQIVESYEDGTGYIVTTSVDTDFYDLHGYYDYSKYGMHGPMREFDDEDIAWANGYGWQTIDMDFDTYFYIYGVAEVAVGLSEFDNGFKAFSYLFLQAADRDVKIKPGNIDLEIKLIDLDYSYGYDGGSEPQKVVYVKEGSEFIITPDYREIYDSWLITFYEEDNTEVIFKVLLDSDFIRQEHDREKIYEGFTVTSKVVPVGEIYSSM
jgi:alpha-tubulin suppressor-like RCC1 family protein/tetratricopeptide (TPR) repeat protein